ncbi:MAG: hypothetical protein ACI9VR_001146 [Cognaticolwellia sp.]|jgi:hypothetical protein
MKRSVWLVGLGLALCAGLALAATPEPIEVLSDPDWLDTVLVPDGPSVQLHLSPVPYSGRRAVHPFFLVRGTDQELHRYEVWQSAGMSGDHLWVDDNTPYFTMGTGTVFFAETTGEQALAVIQVLESGYPWAGRYAMLAGPNSNTYAAWVLEQSGWAIELPEQSLGKGWGCR